jgi:large subunit ribosomal protein L13
VRTFTPKPGDITRDWYVIDATDIVLGRLGTQVANLLRGKHKTIFSSHVDTGDFVVVINAEKVALSGSKLTQKMDYRHSGFPGGLRATNYAELLATDPRRAIEKAVKGMLPHNKLGNAQISKLKVYAGPTHPHTAQNPQPFVITQVAQ